MAVVALVLGALSWFNPDARAAGQTVVVWNDFDYTSPTAGLNTINVIKAHGDTVVELTTNNAHDVQDALATADVFVFPEMDVGDPISDLPPAAATVISEWVEDGGRLVVLSPFAGSSLPLANFILGPTASGGTAVACPCTKTAAAAGTDFASGPAKLGQQSSTGSFTVASLPAGSTVAYTSDADPAYGAVAIIPEESGSVVVLGPDMLTVDATTGWPEVVGLAMGQPAPPTLSIDDVHVTEGGVADLTVMLSAPSTTDIAISFTSADGTATAPGDYTAISGAVLIPAGATTGLIGVDARADDVADDGEMFTVTITATSGATIVDDTGTVTIDEPATAVVATPRFTG
jgi:hypothetical protein